MHSPKNYTDAEILEQVALLRQPGQFGRVTIDSFDGTIIQIECTKRLRKTGHGVKPNGDR